jgi:hypothetical protein
MRIGAGVASLAVVVACTSGGGSGPASGGVSAAQACADNAHQRCTQLESCSPTDTQLRYGSESACETRETNNCATSLAEPFNGNTAAAVEACANAYAGWACPDYINSTNIPPACKQQLGPIINGGSCAIDGQCQSGFCGIAPGAACGTCAPVPKVGASCALLTSCGPGLACTTDTFKCVVFGVRGSPCGKGAVCGVELSCVGADVATGVQGTCEQAGEQTGEACDPTERTGAGCDRNAGLACNGGVEGEPAEGGPSVEGGVEGGVEEAGVPSNTCQAVIVAAAGQPCGNDVVGQPAYCQAEGTCTGASGTSPGMCTSAAADGAACDLTSGPGCVTPARCIGNGGTAGTCQYSGAQSCH